MVFLMSPNEFVEWGGRRWYMSRRLGYYSRKSELLHRAVWESANGPIPPGFVVHHLDGNLRNNNVDNLVAMSRKDHAKIHKSAEAMSETMRNLPYHNYCCEECGVEFQSRRSYPPRFCSRKCWCASRVVRS